MSDGLGLSEEEVRQLRELEGLLDEERFYEAFGVNNSAPASEIREAYYQLSRKWHPDRYFRRDTGGHTERIQKVFMQLTSAFQRLSSIEERSLYDQTHIQTSNDDAPQRQRNTHRRGRRRRQHRERRRQTRESTPEPGTKNRRVQTRKEKRRESFLSNVQQNIEEQTRRAEQFFEIGKRDYEDNKPINAISSLHLACKLAPNNREYLTLFNEVRTAARAARGAEFITEAESAESFQNYHVAIEKYKRAVEYEVDDGRAYARLAYLLQRLDPDPRESLRLMQIAVQKIPSNVDYRCILGEMYLGQGLKLNARREFQKALEIDRSCERAKEGMKQL